MEIEGDKMNKETALKNIEIAESLLGDIKKHILSLNDPNPNLEIWERGREEPNKELLKRNRLIIAKKLKDIEESWEVLNKNGYR